MINLQLLLQVSYTVRYKYNTEHLALCCADIERSVSNGLHKRQKPCSHQLLQQDHDLDQATAQTAGVFCQHGIQVDELLGQICVPSSSQQHHQHLGFAA